MTNVDVIYTTGQETRRDPLNGWGPSSQRGKDDEENRWEEQKKDYFKALIISYNTLLTFNMQHKQSVNYN